MGHRLPTAGVFVIQREVVGREERYLERAFGEEYLDYKERVRRWAGCAQPVEFTPNGLLVQAGVANLPSALLAVRYRSPSSRPPHASRRSQQSLEQDPLAPPAANIEPGSRQQLSAGLGSAASGHCVLGPESHPNRRTLVGLG